MSARPSDPDLLVLGGGTAGLAAARTGARSGKRMIMVQDGPVGGDCTFTGCVPSKTLIESAAAGLDFAAATTRIRDAVDRIARTETADVLRGEGVDVLEGRARFTAAGRVRIETAGGTRDVHASRVVVATGSRPARPDVPGGDDPRVLDADTVWDLAERPARLVVLGAGPVGCELAQAFRRLGSAVTLVEQGSRLLGAEDAAAGAVLLDVFTREGIDVRLGRAVASIAAEPDELRVRLTDGTDVPADHVLVATGRTPATRGLDCAAAGVRLGPGGEVVVDDAMATSARGVWAAGDVTGRLLFTHAADEMGRAAATNALRRLPLLHVRARHIPRVTFTDPEVAQVGLTESEAADAGAWVAELPMSAVDRAIAADRTEGFVKLIVAPRARVTALGRVVGATVVAPRAGEMIHELALAARTGMVAVRLAQTVHAYPTWSTAVRSAAAQLLFEVDGRRARPARPAVDTNG